MTDVKVSVEINLTESTKKFLAECIANVLTSNIEPVASQPAKPAAPKATPAPAKPAVPKTVNPGAITTAPKTEPQPAKLESQNPSITIDDVRKVVASKAAEHRNEVKTKLTELGARNVTTLDPSKYQELVDYLNTL